MTGSLRRRILAGTAAALVVVFAALAVVLYVSVRAWLLGEMDRGLVAQARALAALTEVHHGRVIMDFDSGQPPEFLAVEHAQFFELWTSGGNVLARSPSLGDRDLSHQVPPGEAPAVRFVTLPNGRAGRQVAITFSPGHDANEAPTDAAILPVTLQVARDMHDLTRAAASLRRIFGIACGAALLICVGLSGWLIRRALRPLDAIAGRISQVGTRRLADRLDANNVPTELLPIVGRLNELLSRLEAAFNRERAFSADVAHELRTPLAGLETALEVCLSRPRESGDYQKLATQCLRTVRDMHALVDNLLVLARAEAGALAVRLTQFDLAALLDECWEPFGARAASRRLLVSRNGHGVGPITTDREKLRLVLCNLFDNAVTYADPGGRMSIDVRRPNGRIELHVSNTGNRLTCQQMSHAFERFWRGDPARAETGAHCGLGLPLCKELMTLLGGDISLESTEAGTFLAKVTMPMQAAIT